MLIFDNETNNKYFNFLNDILINIDDTSNEFDYYIEGNDDVFTYEFIKPERYPRLPIMPLIGGNFINKYKKYKNKYLELKKKLHK